MPHEPHAPDESPSAPRAFDDFDLELDDFVTARSPVGDAREPLSAPDLIGVLDAAGASLRGARDLAPEEGDGGGHEAAHSAEAVGRALFERAFSGEVRRLYDRSLQKAEGEGKGLRIRLRIGTPALARLPWELLYDPQARRHLALSDATPVVRHPEVARAIRPLAVGSLSILAVAASPSDLPRLDLAEERRRLERSLADVPGRMRPSLTWREDLPAEELLHVLREGAFNIIHFAGHGDFDEEHGEGLLAMTGRDGRKELLHAHTLGEVLADHRSLRLVVLNACEGAASGARDRLSSIAASLLAMGVPAVLAMQAPVQDEDAIAFSEELYGALARGLPIDAAVNLGRKRLALREPELGAWANPVLFLRAESGALFVPRRRWPLYAAAAAGALALAAGAAALIASRPIERPMRAQSGMALSVTSTPRPRVRVVAVFRDQPRLRAALAGALKGLAVEKAPEQLVAEQAAAALGRRITVYDFEATPTGPQAATLWILLDRGGARIAPWPLDAVEMHLCLAEPASAPACTSPEISLGLALAKGMDSDLSHADLAGAALERWLSRTPDRELFHDLFQLRIRADAVVDQGHRVRTKLDYTTIRAKRFTSVFAVDAEPSDHLIPFSACDLAAVGGPLGSSRCGEPPGTLPAGAPPPGAQRAWVYYLGRSGQ